MKRSLLWRWRILAPVVVLGIISLAAGSQQPALTLHPRLYFSEAELTSLRAQRADGEHAVIWKNIAESADWCLTKTPRKEWIAPLKDDPIYENLYDRFYAMMMDMAITEHSAFAYALSGEDKYGDAARQWALACCRAWKPDADQEPDDGKAYAVCRLLKGVAVSYDMVYDRFTADERNELKSMLATTAANYYQRYFTRADIAGPDFHTHHAHVQISSFGVVALALLGEIPEAQQWLDYCVKKFEDDLLPKGLAPDGAQIEGATFWASTMQYRLFFMDPLRRVTGRDLYAKFKDTMNADLALGSIAAEKQPGWNQPNETVLISPPYGQLDYYAPVLVALAREYRRPVYQQLALWDHSMGQIQQTRYITPHKREQLLFELGGYAYAWYDPSVASEASESKLSYAFPSIGQAYARASWKPGGIVAGISIDGTTIIHAGRTPVLMDSRLGQEGSVKLTLDPLKDDGATAILQTRAADSPYVTVELHRPDRVTVRWPHLKSPWRFWCLKTPEQRGDALVWNNAAELRVIHGTLGQLNPKGNTPPHAVGNGKLNLIDPAPREYPTIDVTPTPDGQVEIEVRLLRGAEK